MSNGPAPRRAAARLIRSAALMAAVWAVGVYAQSAPVTQPKPPEQEITVDAKSVSYDKKTDTVSASGSVVVRRGESVLRADEVKLNRQTNEAQAQGDAVLTSPQAEIHASSMQLDLTDETGSLSDARVYSDRGGYTLNGEQIEKRIGQSYRIINGRFTTCNCESGPPSWSIAGDSLDVTLNGYGYVNGGSLRVLDWPVLWLPRAAFPAYRERESGLLIPRVGFSNRRGFQLLQPFYWAISKSQDATLSFDLETSARIGLLGEYRYAFSRRTFGEFQVGYFNDSIGSNNFHISVPQGINPVAPDNRVGVIGHHTQDLGPLTGYADLLLVGDNLFLREMNTFTANERREGDLRTLPFTTSRAGLLEEWQRALVQAQVIYYQDLIGPIVQQMRPTNPNAATQVTSLVIQRLPEVDLAAQKQLGFGLLGDVTGSLTDFVRGTGITGFRGDVRPAAELALPLGPSFFGTLHAAGRETAYGLTQNEMFGGFTGTLPQAGFKEVPTTSSRELFELRGETGTEFDRVYDFPYFGLDKLKHTIEPTLQYLYVPPVDQGDLPVFDGIDRINKRSLFTYGVATRLLARSAPTTEGEQGEVYELARASATQSYDFLRDIPPTTNFTSQGIPENPRKGDHFSDIDFALRVNPTTATSIRGYATYDTSDNTLSSATIGIRLRQPQRLFGQDIRPRLLTRATFNIDYRFITDSILQLLDTSITLPLTQRIAALYAMRYDVNTDTFLENYVGVRLLSSCDCWALNLGFTQTHNPSEVQVQAQFQLAGFGTNFGGLRDY